MPVSYVFTRWSLTCSHQISLMDEGGNTKDDLKLPSGTDEAEKLAKDLSAEFEDGKELVVTVIKVQPRGPQTDPGLKQTYLIHEL